MATKTPLDDIKAGIEKRNWKRVAAGYKKMTGQSLPVPDHEDALSIPKVVYDALLFYADLANWARTGDDFDPKPAAVAHDKGQKARDVLNHAGPVEAEEDEEPSPAPSSPSRIIMPGDPEPTPVKTNRRVTETSHFIVQHNDGEVDGDKKYCRREPFKPGMTNQFRDDKTLETQFIAQDQAWAAKHTPTPRRTEQETGLIAKIKCAKCEKMFEADVSETRRSAGDDTMSFVCQGCIRKAIPRD